MKLFTLKNNMNNFLEKKTFYTGGGLAGYKIEMFHFFFFLHTFYFYAICYNVEQ